MLARKDRTRLSQGERNRRITRFGRALPASSMRNFAAGSAILAFCCPGREIFLAGPIAVVQLPGNAYISRLVPPWPNCGFGRRNLAAWRSVFHFSRDS
jgi:hypothetical protein